MAKHVALLFVAISAADREILEEEEFIMEKCAADYGLEKDKWGKALSISMINYFNNGEAALERSIGKLSIILNREQKKELTEDLLAIALADDILHENEKAVLKKVCKGFNIHLKIPRKFLSKNK